MLVKIKLNFYISLSLVIGLSLMLAFLAIELLSFIGGISMFNASASMFCILLFPFYSGEIYRPVKGFLLESSYFTRWCKLSSHTLSYLPNHNVLSATFLLLVSTSFQYIITT